MSRADGSPQGHRTRPRHELELEVVAWRKACSAAHASLSRPVLRQSKVDLYGNKVVRVVAHTLRLLILLGHFYAARELDRAFFSLRPAGPSTPSDPGHKTTRVEKHVLGDGLGLSRGTVQLAWMQSLSLALLPGGDPDDFAVLLRDLKLASADSGGISPVMVAFLVRKADGLARRLGEAGPDAAEDGLFSVDNFLVGARTSRKYQGERVVEMAFLERELRGLEPQERKPARGELALGSVHLPRIDEAMQQLVQELDQDPPDDLPEFVVLERRAHALHLTIRFVLLRAQVGQSLSDPNERHRMTSESITSAAALYDVLLSLLPSVSDNPSMFAALRQRQSSVFYRILWTCLGVTALPRSVEAHAHHQRHVDSIPLPPPDLPALDLALTTVSSTLAVLASLPPAPPLSIAPAYWYHFILTLALPSCPTRRAISPTSPRTPWRVLKRAFSLLLAASAHDRAKSPPGAPLNSNLFDRRGVAFHLVRATLLGGSGGGEGEETVEGRLAFLLGVLDGMKEMGDGVDRRMIMPVIKEVLVAEWPGAGLKPWRKQVLGTMWRAWPEFAPEAKVRPFLC